MILIQDFIEDRVLVEEFEQKYLALFKSETEVMTSEHFKVLDSLFASVDCYWKECQEGQESKFEISEVQLRKDAHNALEKLRNFQ